MGFTSVEKWLTLTIVEKSKITRKKTKLKSSGGVLERARTKLRMTRREVVELFNEQSSTPLHEITLYKYEKGKLRLPRAAAPLLAGILQIELGDLVADNTRPSKQLRYAGLPHTDSEILEFALTMGRLDDANRHLPKVNFERATLDSSNQALEKLATGDIDIALFNTNQFDMQDGRIANSVLKLGPVVRFHSYAILFAPPENVQWLSFQELFNRQMPRMSRAARLESALSCMLAQIWPTDGSVEPKVLFAPDSDRRTLLLLLLSLARDRATEESEPRLRALQHAIEQVKPNGDTEDGCFQQFVKCLTEPHERRGGAIFAGTIPQRLLAEARGAGLLMTPENFAWLATARDSVDRTLQPTKSLLVNRQSYTGEPEMFDAAIVRWNAAVQYIQSQPAPNLASAYLTGAIRREMSNYVGLPVDPSPEELAARIFGERMIVLLPHGTD